MDDKTMAHVLGETIAKLYFELKGYFVYTNSSGKAEFDLVISKDRELYSVEVKTVSALKTSTKGDYFEVQLKSVRSNKTENTIHNFSNIGLDYLVVVDTATRRIAVFNALEIEAKSTMRIYDDKFMDLGTLAESA